MSSKKVVTISELAKIVQRGIHALSTEIIEMKGEIHDIRRDMVTQQDIRNELKKVSYAREIDELYRRVKNIEKHIGIKPV